MRVREFCKISISRIWHIQHLWLQVRRLLWVERQPRQQSVERGGSFPHTSRQGKRVNQVNLIRFTEISDFAKICSKKAPLHHTSGGWQDKLISVWNSQLKTTKIQPNIHLTIYIVNTFPLEVFIYKELWRMILKWQESHILQIIHLPSGHQCQMGKSVVTDNCKES